MTKGIFNVVKTTFKSNCSEFYNELFQEFIFCLLFFEGLFYSDVVWMQK